MDLTIKSIVTIPKRVNLPLRLGAVSEQRELIEQNLWVLEGRWTGLILFCLTGGELRYGALREKISGITDAVLCRRLAELEERGLVSRRTVGSRPPEVWYGITRDAEGLSGVFEALASWKRPRRRRFTGRR